MKKVVFIIGGVLVLSICAVVLLYKSVTMPQPTGEVHSEIELSKPVLGPYSGEKFYIKCENGVYTLVPAVTYRAPVLVVGKKKHYHTDVLAQLVPVDLCVIWGVLAEPEYLKDLRFTQKGRYCQLVYKPGSPVEPYVGLHEFTHIHVIPATENILKALNSIKEGQKVILEGVLVDIYLEDEIIAQTSVEPTDDSCEILYVTKIRIGNNIYE